MQEAYIQDIDTGGTHIAGHIQLVQHKWRIKHPEALIPHQLAFLRNASGSAGRSFEALTSLTHERSAVTMGTRGTARPPHDITRAVTEGLSLASYQTRRMCARPGAGGEACYFMILAPKYIQT